MNNKKIKPTRQPKNNNSQYLEKIKPVYNVSSLNNANQRKVVCTLLKRAAII